MVNERHERLREIAERLHRWRQVPTYLLDQQVQLHGLCLWTITDGEPPSLTGHDAPDREMAARLCAECPVQDECLEVELRIAGENTVGVWGGLSEEDRRALHPMWRARHRETDDAEGDEER